MRPRVLRGWQSTTRDLFVICFKPILDVYTLFGPLNSLYFKMLYYYLKDILMAHIL